MKRNERKQTQLLNSPLGSCPPFLIINANTIVDNRHSKSYRRKYSWGACDIENPDYTDFLLFYNLLIGYLYFPLKERTKVLYDMYQDNKLAAIEKNNIEHEKKDNFMIDFSLGMAMGVGILGAITIFAKKAKIL